MEDVARKYMGVESTQKYCEAHELTLSGHPWNVDTGEEAIQTRILIGNLIMTFKSKGKALEITRLNKVAYLDPSSNPRSKPQRFSVKNCKSSTSDKLQTFKTMFGIFCIKF